METLFVLIATVILLMALHAGDTGTRRRPGLRDRRIILPNHPSGGRSTATPLAE